MIKSPIKNLNLRIWREFMSKKELTILVNDDTMAWIDLPKGRIEVRIDGRLVYEENSLRFTNAEN